MVETRGMKRRARTVDYISPLPDAILLHILSFLPVRDWIVVSCISKRWRNLWTQISNLTLTELETIRPLISKNKCPICRALPSPNSTSCKLHIIEAARIKFGNSVDRILLLHSGCTINKFHLSLNYELEGWHSRRIDTWLKLAFTSNIEQIELSFYDRKMEVYLRRHGFHRRHAYQTQLYEIPHHNVSPRLLNSLTLHHCKFKVSSFKRFESLRRLVLKQVILHDTSVTLLASRCPALEDLHLELCIISHDFLVREEDLMIKRLLLDRCRPQDMLTIQMAISTPQLESLTIVGCFATTPYVGKVTKPLHALIDIRTIVDNSRMNEQGINLTSFLAGLQSCRSLRLTSWSIQALPAEGIMIRQPLVLFPHLIHLSLAVGLGKQELPSIVDLIWRCKNLEALTIEVHKYLSSVGLNNQEHANQVIPGFDEDNFWQSQDWPYCCLQTRLKRVIMTGFTGTKHEMNILHFLLAKADVLERVSISYTLKNIEPSILGQKVIHEIMWYDRTSKAAQLWITPHPPK
ncbi:hypothetical protein CRG98_045876 [Punica granatum]|uniref:F-box domain-containing protein n=1 Tax=Punica granatum TaxID=22663 RepID=A0A2I0HPU3_PUNGR|nr:hypothetical protein CRG98_045876 [Punica granatum]